MAQFVLENVTKLYAGPRRESISAVRNLCLEVKPGELLVLVGPSGSGKSTLLRLIAGLEDLSAGTIAMDGQLLNGIPPQARDVAMVFQNYALYPHMTAFENMALGLKLRKVPKPEINTRVREVADLLGIGPLLNRKPHDLSGGERQRVAVGRAMVRRPQIFLFDEPFSNLDLPLRAQLRAELLKLHARLAAAMIYVTHDQAEAMTMGGRIAVLNRGELVQVAIAEHLYGRPSNVFVAKFFGWPPINFLRGRILKKDGGLAFLPVSGATKHQSAERQSAGGSPSQGEGQSTAALRQRQLYSPSGSTRLPLPEGEGWGEGDQSIAPFPLPPPSLAPLQSSVGRELLLGLRPEHVLLHPADSAAEGLLIARVERIEWLGAESHVYLTGGANSLVARIHGGQRFQPGQSLRVSFALEHALWFDPATELRL